MFRPNWKMLLIGTVLVATLTIGGSTADATWGYYHPTTWTCSPCVTPYVATYSCDPCGDPCGGWYLGYRPGPIRRALFGSCRWYYAGCGTCSGWGCSACDTVESCCEGGVTTTPTEATPTEATPTTPDTPTPAVPDTPPTTPTEPEPSTPTTPGFSEPTETFPIPPATPVVPPATPAPFDPPAVTPSPADIPPAIPETPAPVTPLEPFGNPLPTPAEPPAAAPEPPAFPAARAVPTPANSGLLTIWVPYDAKVTINGRVTKSVGSRRQYVSYDLQPGHEYRYEVLAEVVRDGRVYEELHEVTMTAGTRSAVPFRFNIPDQNLAATY